MAVLRLGRTTTRKRPRKWPGSSAIASPQLKRLDTRAGPYSPPTPKFFENPMKTDSTAVRLADYRPPDFAIESVHLDFVLDPQRTRVTARLKLRRTNPGAVTLDLIGDELALID